MEESLVALLRGAPTVGAIVATRVYPLNRPQGSALPALVYRRVSSQPGVTYGGAEDCTESRVQLDCYATTFAGAKALARAVRRVLHGYSGTVAGVVFQGVFMDAERQFYEGEEPETIYRASLDFIVWAVEP